MNTKFYLALGLFCAIISGCHFSVGTKKDLTTGLSINYNGFSVQDAILIDNHGSRMKNDVVHLDTTFGVLFTGIENYKVKDDKVFPSCEISIKDKSGKLLDDIPNILGSTSEQGANPVDARTLTATIRLHAPTYSPGNTYHIIITVLDREEPKNKIVAEGDVAVQ